MSTNISRATRAYMAAHPGVSYQKARAAVVAALADTPTTSPASPTGTPARDTDTAGPAFVFIEHDDPGDEPVAVGPFPSEDAARNAAAGRTVLALQPWQDWATSPQGPHHVDPDTEDDCAVCGQPMFATVDGTDHHLNEDGVDPVNTTRDADHAPVRLQTIECPVCGADDTRFKPSGPNDPHPLECGDCGHLFSATDPNNDLLCRFCGKRMLVDSNGVSHHWSEDRAENIDYDADADHVAVLDTGDPHDTEREAPNSTTTTDRHPYTVAFAEYESRQMIVAVEDQHDFTAADLDFDYENPDAIPAAWLLDSLRQHPDEYLPSTVDAPDADAAEIRAIITADLTRNT